MKNKFTKFFSGAGYLAIIGIITLASALILASVIAVPPIGIVLAGAAVISTAYAPSNCL